MKSKWLKLAIVWSRKMAYSALSVILCILCFQRKTFKNIFNCTTAGDNDCVAAVERLPALYSIVY